MQDADRADQSHNRRTGLLERRAMLSIFSKDALNSPRPCAKRSVCGIRVPCTKDPQDLRKSASRVS